MPSTPTSTSVTSCFGDTARPVGQTGLRLGTRGHVLPPSVVRNVPSSLLPWLVPANIVLGDFLSTARVGTRSPFRPSWLHVGSAPPPWPPEPPAPPAPAKPPDPELDADVEVPDEDSEFEDPQAMGPTNKATAIDEVNEIRIGCSRRAGRLH